jgi:hypothetical protein
MKYLKLLLKNMILSTITLYSLNLVFNKVGILIPINFFSIVAGMMFGLSGIIMYIILVIKFFS